MSVKLVAVGDGAVGKTSMLICYTKNEFPEEYIPTVFDNYSTTVTLGDEVISLAIWDTAGQEEYESIRPLSYPSTDVFLLCYSVVQQSSLDNIAEKWLPEVKHHCPSSRTLVVGLKTDLRDSVEEIKKLEAKNQKPIFPNDVQEFIKENNIECDGFCECSAKTQKGLKEVMIQAVRVCVGNGHTKTSTPTPDKDKLKKKSKSSKERKCCVLL
ncbi:Rho family GTPase [Entamoeba histolytica HM-1:IMSS-B]|uniref:small monomeric GTPase n=8 Tax=Entamoeba TaxID=5758 RepID=C4LZV2_ENTH1|nr:Rho family GTPase [Entamoeba nuttalli P19]XP_654700.1 Rho family GTPase [Entamoeba histolytica HM-1:IMSS]EMD47787.1 Rho family GTPase, putative [Entamoeba histolytica KU27]EMH74936.1 Rho family GTPase [Entamoeba histolytica HM-1:IMSS-B]EMS14012.1 Rho family GTPase [Entamoeba histolytica HM-3:IMSS]ENY64539.1 Rho family GTPase, putative [Entamoeba histolytica HM-1:IMSS-A]GAT94412.1 Rho family GTPase [Entamoeba histolytica]|eukprot:XP_008855436.1 Rho family GTPase [Entamoeba nuttalli P19]